MHTQAPRAAAGYEGCSFGNILQDCFASGVIIIDAGGKIVRLNSRAAKILGLSAGSPPPESIDSLPSALQSAFRAAQTNGPGVNDQEISVTTDENVTSTLSVTVIPVSGEKKSGVLVVLLNDVSSTGKLEQEMRRLDRLASIGTLSASMAHEIKNALVPIKTFIDLLLERDPGVELAATVRREMDRVDTIVSSILKYAAPARPALSRVRIHEILEHSLRLAQHHVEGKLISFHRQFNAPSDSFTGDDHQLEQAFVNLMLNAVEAMGAEGILTIRTDKVADGHNSEVRQGSGRSGFLRVQISDTGKGIPEEQIVSIFEPFFTTKTNGTGLGLAVTRRIIEEHHGIIHVESQPARGTTFTVQLPCSETAPRG